MLLLLSPLKPHKQCSGIGEGVRGGMFEYFEFVENAKYFILMEKYRMKTKAQKMSQSKNKTLTQTPLSDSLFSDERALKEEYREKAKLQQKQVKMFKYNTCVVAVGRCWMVYDEMRVNVSIVLLCDLTK